MPSSTSPPACCFPWAAPDGLPQVLGRLNASGSPRLALLVSSYGIVTALIIENWAPKQAFLYIMGAAFSGLILSWVVSLAAHVSFRWRLTRSKSRRCPCGLPLGLWGSILGFVLVSAAVLHTLLALARKRNRRPRVLCVALTVAYIFLKSSRRSNVALLPT
jgi:L-asparagine transporter-like permease